MRRLLVGLLLIAGCHKDAPSPSPKEADALWALAPEGAQLGVVATPHALAMIEHGWQDVHAFVEKAPDLAELSQYLDSQLQQLTGTRDIKLADYGLTSEKGAALFVVHAKEVVLVVPVADRDKFLAKAHGTKGADVDTIREATCKTLHTVYVCVSDTALFDMLGKSKLRDRLDVRGDVEVVAEGLPDMPMKSAAVVAQLERGALVVRGTLAGMPASTAQLGAAIKPVLDRQHSAGFGVVNLAAFLSSMPDVSIGAGVSTSQLAHSIAGPMTMSVPAGALGADVRIALTDPAPAQTLVDHCAELLPPETSATAKDGTCHVTIPQIKLGLDAWLDGKTLHIGTKNAPVGKAAALTPLGAELADGSWSFAFWGRGSVLAMPDLSIPVPPDAAKDPAVAAPLRMMTVVNELGIGVRLDGDTLKFVGTVRTAWSNPDDVVARLVAMNPTDVFAGKGSAVTQGIPSTAPLARDLEAGYAGLMLPVSLIGVASAIAIPAFIEYMHRSQRAPGE